MPLYVSVNNKFYGVWAMDDGTSGDAVPAALKTDEITAKIKQLKGDHKQAASRK